MVPVLSDWWCSEGDGRESRQWQSLCSWHTTGRHLSHPGRGEEPVSQDCKVVGGSRVKSRQNTTGGQNQKVVQCLEQCASREIPKGEDRGEPWSQHCCVLWIKDPSAWIWKENVSPGLEMQQRKGCGTTLAKSVTLSALRTQAQTEVHVPRHCIRMLWRETHFFFFGPVCSIINDHQTAARMFPPITANKTQGKAPLGTSCKSGLGCLVWGCTQKKAFLIGCTGAP